MPQADEQTNRTLKEVSKNKQADLIKQIGSARYQIKWLDDDSFEARADGLVAKFTRVGSKSTSASETEPVQPFSERPGAKESAFFWQIALGLGAVLVIIWLIKKAADPKPPPRL